MTEKQAGQKDELNLIELLNATWKGIIRLFKLLVEILLFLLIFGIWRIHWLLLIVILGAGTGYLLYHGTERYYSSEMIAQPNGFTSIDMANYINDIQDMCERRNMEAISNAFEISEEDAEQIRNIAAFFFIDVNHDGIGDHVDYKYKYKPEDTTQSIMLDRILIRAEVLDNTIFQEIRSGIIKYINNNPYLIKVNDIRKRELGDLIAQADREISKLDSLQNFEYYKGPEEGEGTRSGQIVVLNEKVTQLYYQDKVTLLTQKLSYQKALELATDPITIIKDFTVLQSEENPLSEYLIKYGLLFGFLGYFVLLFFHYRRKVIAFLSSKRS